MPTIRSFRDLKSEDNEENGEIESGRGNFSENAYSRRNIPKARGNEGISYVYHELQESALCGQHCMNNLLQARCFTELQLGGIAQQLDAEERMLGLTENANVDATGNFSIQVLRRALQQSHNIELTVWSGGNPLHEDGFIVNRREHWFAIRKINGRWYNLNSTIERPEYVQDFQLNAFLSQIRLDGFSVFVPTKGKLPTCGKLPPGYRGDIMDGRYWIKEEDILNPPVDAKTEGKNGGSTKDATVPFAGRGRRLDGKVEAPSQASYNGFGGSNLGDEEEDPELAAAIAASLASVNTHSSPFATPSVMDGIDDPDLALAMQLSLAEQQSSAHQVDDKDIVVNNGPAKSDKELQREKRLAALAARGL